MGQHQTPIKISPPTAFQLQLPWIVLYVSQPGYCQVQYSTLHNKPAIIDPIPTFILILPPPFHRCPPPPSLPIIPHNQ